MSLSVWFSSACKSNSNLQTYECLFRIFAMGQSFAEFLLYIFHVLILKRNINVMCLEFANLDTYKFILETPVQTKECCSVVS